MTGDDRVRLAPARLAAAKDVSLVLQPIILHRTEHDAIARGGYSRQSEPPPLPRLAPLQPA
jgi:hypothetical protein